MKRIKKFHLLSVLGDMKPKPYNDVVMLLTLHFANPANRQEIWGTERIPNNSHMSTEIEKMLKKIAEDGLIERVDNVHTLEVKKKTCRHTEHDLKKLCLVYTLGLREYDLKITKKGRELLGMEQVARNGDYSWYGANYGFDGTLEKASSINPNLFK